MIISDGEFYDVSGFALTWHKHIYQRLGFLFRLLLPALVHAGVVAGVLHRRVVNEQSGRVVPREDEAVFWERFGPNHVSFPGAADVERGHELQGEVFFVGHNSWWRESGGDWNKGFDALEGFFNNREMCKL